MHALAACITLLRTDKTANFLNHTVLIGWECYSIGWECHSIGCHGANHPISSWNKKKQVAHIQTISHTNPYFTKMMCLERLHEWDAMS